MNLDQFFKKSELIPAIVQDAESREVLMLAYMNRQALEQTLQTKKSTFYSRSRQSLWVKGETSGNFQFVLQALYDCDEDTILLLVKPAGPACHTGNHTCFYRSFCMEEEQ